MNVPGPLSHAVPAAVDASTREELAQEMQVISTAPRIYRLPRFLSDEECSHMISLAEGKLRPCNEISAGVHRSGWGMFMKDGEEDSPLMRGVLKRISRLIAVEDMCEVMQVLRYREGEETSAHHDYFNPETPNGAMKIGLYGQRSATLIMYLNEVTEGGATSFPAINVSIQPRPGDAILFYNCRPDGAVDPLSLHQGDKVLQGDKWIAIKLVNSKAPTKTLS
eukprot:TRINITY_DN12349_c0_g1_i2.p1 TRINITY_DN12349_c0_g1~~TRINITY_DN12349_c0_g1_i2.p1  ORF type:complete len:222 (-),score=40.77 TRINITY_DN12349_c0_g1_i2:54-719(-)